MNTDIQNDVYDECRAQSQPGKIKLKEKRKKEKKNSFLSWIYQKIAGTHLPVEFGLQDEEYQ